MMTLFEVSSELAHRLAQYLHPRWNGTRAVFGGTEKFQSDPHWRDQVLFYEYFHGDNGAGLGPATRPAGPGWWRNSSSFTAFWTPSGYWKLAVRLLSLGSPTLLRIDGSTRFSMGGLEAHAIRPTMAVVLDFNHYGPAKEWSE